MTWVVFVTGSGILFWGFYITNNPCLGVRVLEKMEICCSLKSIAGGTCGFDRKDCAHATQVVPILSCKRGISSHLRSCKFSGPKNEVELILCRCGMFKAPHNIEELTVCPNHRSVFGVGWSRSSNTRCRMPSQISGHKRKLPKAERGISKHMSQMILKRTGKLIQIGSGEYRQRSYFETRPTTLILAVYLLLFILYRDMYEL